MNCFKMTNYKLTRIEYPNIAPKLVLLHGLGGTHRYWNTGLAELTKHFHVILIDLLGFGDSPKPWINYTKHQHLLALEQCLEDIDQFILVGHSLGAVLALTYTAKNPSKCSSQILISLPYFPDETAAYHWMRRTPSGWLMTNTLTAVITCMITRYLMKKILPKLLPQFPIEIIEDLLKHNVFSSTTSLWNVIYRSTIVNDLKALNTKVKTLCIHAVDDDTAPYQNINSLCQQFPNINLLTLKNGEHHPWLWQNRKCIDELFKLTSI